jgi:hypothetical protein
MSKPVFVYTIHIASTPEKVFMAMILGCSDVKRPRVQPF